MVIGSIQYINLLIQILYTIYQDNQLAVVQRTDDDDHPADLAATTPAPATVKIVSTVFSDPVVDTGTDETTDDQTPAITHDTINNDADAQKTAVTVAAVAAVDESTSSNSSTLSGSSSTAKMTAPSTATNKCRSAIGMRRINLPLTRAQTAKSIGSTSNSAASPTNHMPQHAARLSPKPTTPVVPTTPQSLTAVVAAPVPLPTPPPPSSLPAAAAEREREQGGDYLIEICGRYLNVYGAGAVKFIDRQWNGTKAADVHTLKFSYVHFNAVVPVLARIKQRFPNAENFVFRETSISALGQLNALADVQVGVWVGGWGVVFDQDIQTGATN